MNRLIVARSRLLSDGGRLQLEEAELHYLMTVRRLSVGALVELRDGDGGRYSASLTGDNQLQYGGRESLPRLSGCAVHLAFSPPRGRRVDLILEKGTEIGAAAFHPVYTDRTVRKLTPIKARWEQVIEAAARQSGATHTPSLWESSTFDDFLALPFAGLRLIAHPQSKAGIRDLLPPLPPQSALVLTGPEGGFSDDELQRAADAGFAALGLGSQILRAETAPLVALTLLRHHLGDLG